MSWPQTKLDVVNAALALTGNNLVAAADDGSDEWIVGSAAYEHAFEYALDGHDWKQITNVVTLNPTGVAPADPEFDTAYAKPADCVHIIWVRQYMPPTTPIPPLPLPPLAVGPGYTATTLGSGRSITYQVLNNQIVVNNYSQPPGSPPPPGTTPISILMKYVSSNPPGIVVNGQAQPAAAAPQMLRTFMTALTRFVMAGIYRGMHEDIASANITEQQAMALLAEAKTRSDQEMPKRAMFNSRLLASRRVRRPYPTIPVGWTGTGVPG